MVLRDSPVQNCSQPSVIGVNDGVPVKFIPGGYHSRKGLVRQKRGRKNILTQIQRNSAIAHKLRAFDKRNLIVQLQNLISVPHQQLKQALGDIAEALKQAVHFLVEVSDFVNGIVIQQLARRHDIVFLTHLVQVDAHCLFLIAKVAALFQISDNILGRNQTESDLQISSERVHDGSLPLGRSAVLRAVRVRQSSGSVLFRRAGR